VRSPPSGPAVDRCAVHRVAARGIAAIGPVKRSAIAWRWRGNAPTIRRRLIPSSCGARRASRSRRNWRRGALKDADALIGIRWMVGAAPNPNIAICSMPERQQCRSQAEAVTANGACPLRCSSRQVRAAAQDIVSRRGISLDNWARQRGLARDQFVLAAQNKDYVFFLNPAKTASAVIGMWRTRTPTAS
jgi:hypothetical protein